MRNLFYIFAFLAIAAFSTSELSAQPGKGGNRGPGKQEGGGKFGGGDKGPGQQGGGIGGRFGGGQGGPGMQRGGNQGRGPGGMRGGNQNGGPGMQGGGMQGGGMGMMMMKRMPLYIALDKDQDGQLSEDEIRNAIKALKTLDKNNDGVIDAQEMAPDMGQMRGQRGQGQGQGPGGMRGQGKGPGGQQGGPGQQGRGPGGIGGQFKGGGNQDNGATIPKRPGKDN